MNLVIDIETENTSADVATGNKRIISIQIGDDVTQEIYYDDSSEYSLSRGKERILSLLSSGCVFVGFYLAFDLPLLKKFLDIDITNYIELQIVRYSSLVDACRPYKINVDHKQKMNEKAEEYTKRDDIRNEARIEAQKRVEEKGDSFDYAFGKCLKSISFGKAIIDSYNEFVQKGGSKDTLFYEYAIGDVICEFRLFKALTEAGKLSGPSS